MDNVDEKTEESSYTVIDYSNQENLQISEVNGITYSKYFCSPKCFYDLGKYESLQFSYLQCKINFSCYTLHCTAQMDKLNLARIAIISIPILT